MSDDKKTHWKRLVNPDYIGAYALPPGMDMTVEIVSVGREKIVVSGGKKEDHTVARLKGQKPLILNATNSKSISRLYGPYIEDWSGKKITLYASTATLGKETVECLRIRPNVEERQKPNIAETRLDAAIESIKKGDYTVEKLKANFFLTFEQEERLDIALAPPAPEQPTQQEQGAANA